MTVRKWGVEGGRERGGTGRRVERGRERESQLSLHSPFKGMPLRICSPLGRPHP